MQADLKENQREIVMQALYQRNITLPELTMENLRELLINLLCAPRSSLGNPTYSSSGGQHTFLVLDQGDLEGWPGFWAQEEETGEEAFLQDDEDCFWT